MLIDVNTSRAVLIGTASHRGESDLDDLPAVRNNLEDLAAALADPDILGMPRDHIAILRDPSDPATVVKAVRAAGAEAAGTLLVYYAGHGLPDENAQLFLALSNTSIKGLPIDALPLQWIRQGIRDSVATTRVLVLDCCYAGLGEPATMSGADLIAAQSAVTGTWTLFSSAKDTPSLAPPGERNTAFTGELIDLLNNGYPEGPAELDGDAVLRALRQRLMLKGFPSPQQNNSDMGYRIAIARNRAATGRGHPVTAPAASARDDSRPEHDATPVADAAPPAPTARSGAARVLNAGFLILIAQLCIIALNIPQQTFTRWPWWVVFAGSIPAIAAGLIAVAMGGVRQYAISASILLWGSVWFAVYSLSVVLAGDVPVLVAECVIGAVVNVALCIWIVASRSGNPFQAAFTACMSVALVLAAIAIGTRNVSVWNATAAVTIVAAVTIAFAQTAALVRR